MSRWADRARSTCRARADPGPATSYVPGPTVMSGPPTGVDVGVAGVPALAGVGLLAAGGAAGVLVPAVDELQPATSTAAARNPQTRA